MGLGNPNFLIFHLGVGLDFQVLLFPWDINTYIYIYGSDACYDKQTQFSTIVRKALLLRRFTPALPKSDADKIQGPNPIIGTPDCCSTLYRNGSNKHTHDVPAKMHLFLL